MEEILLIKDLDTNIYSDLEKESLFFKLLELSKSLKDHKVERKVKYYDLRKQLISLNAGLLTYNVFEKTCSFVLKHKDNSVYNNIKDDFKTLDLGYFEILQEDHPLFDLI